MSKSICLRDERNSLQKGSLCRALVPSEHCLHKADVGSCQPALGAGGPTTHHGRPAPELAPGLSPHLPYILFFKPNLRTRTPFLMKQDVRQNQVKAVSKVCAFSPSPATQHSTPLPRQLPFSEQQISSTDGHQSGKELWLHL